MSLFLEVFLKEVPHILSVSFCLCFSLSLPVCLPTCLFHVHRQKDKQRQTQTDRQTDRQTHTHTHTRTHARTHARTHTSSQGMITPVLHLLSEIRTLSKIALTYLQFHLSLRGELVDQRPQTSEIHQQTDSFHAWHCLLGLVVRRLFDCWLLNVPATG